MSRSKKRRDSSWKKRIYRQIVHRFYARDLLLGLQRNATAESLEYILANMRHCMLFEHRFDLLAYAISKVESEGLFLEFGVADGESIRETAELTPHEIYGFDSFEGLPEDWAGTTSGKGKFSRDGKLPPVPDSVTLHRGWFENSIPPFIEQHPGKIAFLHVDCDIYSSTKCVFEHFGGKLQVGTVILFDEYFNYPNWQDHEFKAFQEFVAESGLGYEYLGYCVRSPQAAVRVTRI